MKIVDNRKKRTTSKQSPKLLQGLIIIMLALLSILVISSMAIATTPELEDENTVDVPQQFGQSDGDEEVDETNETKAQTTKAMIAIGAGIAIGIAGIGSATGIGIAGAAGIGACAEKPDRFSKSLVLQALPMTQGIYGLLTAILLLMGAGLLGGGGKDVAFYVDPVIGLSAIAIGLAVGLTGISAIGQGITAGASIGGTARNPEVFSKGMIFTVMSETLAIFGLLVGILIMVGVGLL
jgi:V/A-type H+-transporting ATPase subunit K